MKLSLPKRIATSLALTGLITMMLAVPGVAAGDAAWQGHSSMTTPRHEPAVAKSGGKVYIMGGFIEGLSAVPLVDIYDPSSDTWDLGPSLPIGPNHAMGAAGGGVVYHLGGYLVALEQPTDRALALVDGAWVDLPPMPAPRAAGAAEFLRGKLYVVGGVGPEGVVDDMFVFDPSAQEWSTAPGPKMAREHETLVRYRGQLYAIGGRALTFETTMASVERFDPATGTWLKAPPLPFPAAGHVSAVSRSGLLVVAGGETAQGALGDVVAFDLRTRRWLTLPDLDPARTGFGAAVFGDRFFVFGGAGADATYYDFTESIDLSLLDR